MQRSIFHLICIGSCMVLCHACSPLKSSPEDEKHQMELTLHEVQTNLDDIRHDINCVRTDLQILDERINRQENSYDSLKKQQSTLMRDKVDAIAQQCQKLEQTIKELKNRQEHLNSQLEKVVTHSNETTTALTQHQKKLNELANISYQHTHTLKELATLKGSLEFLVQSVKGDKVHIVQSGDTLEKIAKRYHTTVDRLKKINQLKKDLIYTGQELIIQE